MRPIKPPTVEQFIDHCIIEQRTIKQGILAQIRFAQLLFSLSLVCLLYPQNSLNAQQVTDHATDRAQQADRKGTEPAVTELPAPTTAVIKQLQYIQSALDTKILERRELGNRIAIANEQDRADLRREANEITEVVTQLRSKLPR